MQSQFKGRNVKLMALILTSLMIAFTFVIGSFIKVPTLNGMAQPADCIVLLSAVLLGKKKGFLVGAFGMGLIDLASGYAYWAPFSFVIQGLMALGTAAVLDAFHDKRNFKIYLLSFVVGGAISAIGYFIANAIVGRLIVGATTSFWASIVYAALHFPGDVSEIILGIIIALPLSPITNKLKHQFLG
ncbi:ECF transporter S component [Clostridium sp.]|uniref:ECF transporter S component n=1 Tax=Clostridium sp. TaxID=1506 RepID=UPI003992726A